MKNKVCILTSVHPPFDVRIFHKEAKSLVKAGYDVTLIAQHDKHEEIDGVKIINLQKPRNRIERMTKTVWSAYRKAVQVNADIYHFHDPELLPIGLKLKRLGKKVIFDSHEFYGLQIKQKKYIPKILRNTIALIFNLYETYVCKRIDAVIEVCTLNGSSYFENRAKKTVVIANYAIISDFKAQHTSPFEKRFSVTCMGSLSYARGITHLIKAVAKTNAKLILCGNFSSNDYQEQLKKLPEYAVVDYRGFVNKKEMDLILCECLAGIATALPIGQYQKTDTLSTKCYDYMAMGVPIIVPNYSYAKKVFEVHKCGICVESDIINEIAGAINYFMANPTKAAEMGKNGRRAVNEKYNWNEEEIKLLELYDAIMKT